MRRFTGIFASRIGLIGQWPHFHVRHVDRKNAVDISFLVEINRQPSDFIF